MRKWVPAIWMAVAGLMLPGWGMAESGSPILPGDRVAIVGNTFADQLRVHGYLETLLLQHTRDTPVSVRNLGWGGDMLSARDRPTNFPTEASTLEGHQTDVIVACFGMGESFAGESGLEDFKEDLRAFLHTHQGKSYNGKSEVRLVLVSPIAYEELGERTPAHRERNQDLERYCQAMGEVAASEGIPMVDLFQPTRYLMEEPRGPKLTRNGIHLNRYGYWVVSRILLEQLVTGGKAGPPHRPWRLRIDAGTGRGEAVGVEFSGLIRQGGGLEFEVIEKTGASLPPPTAEELPVQVAEYRDTLQVENLQPGTYQLWIDEHLVVARGHQEWAAGVEIDTSPAHLEAEELRQAVNDKNLQFTYSWKALNQVHIVGERRKSPSGRALPAEIIAFDELAQQREESLRHQLTPKTRRWRVVRTGN